MGTSSGRAGSSQAKGKTRGSSNPIGKGHDAPRTEPSHYPANHSAKKGASKPAGRANAGVKKGRTGR